MSKKVVFSPDHYYNCPICGEPCRIEKEEGWNTALRVSGRVSVFLCYNPLAHDPLHYYTHIVEETEPNKIALQEFSLDLGKKSILFTNNFKEQKSIVKDSTDASPLEFDFLMLPDFPFLYLLKKRVKTAIVFG
jgi:hypothetical protein